MIYPNGVEWFKCIYVTCNHVVIILIMTVVIAVAEAPYWLLKA